jgi:NAD(P)-dependent dehydrogenase (short-subunit alcohol dehydrogenase family)
MAAVDKPGPGEPGPADPGRGDPGHAVSGYAVLVTGGTRGIGAGVARAFLRSGARVLVCGRAEPAEVPSAGGRVAVFTKADVRDPEQAARAVGRAVKELGRLDVVVSNAGGSPYAAAATASPRFHAKVIELNLIAPLHVAQAAHAVMQRQAAPGQAGQGPAGPGPAVQGQGGGSIIMVGSVSGARPSPGTAAYGAAKAGLQHLVTSLAIEWGPAVRVNCVVPGFVATESVGTQYGDPATVAAIEATVPLRRMATPDDVAQACLFLASPGARYISGACLAVHGGGEPPGFLALGVGSR